MEALKETVAKLQEQLQAALSAKAAQPAQVIQVVTPDSEKVTMRFQADVADDNVAVFGPSGLYGQVTGKMGTVVVPKAEWSRFYTDSVRRMIDRRWLVVLTGMSEDERKLFHCAYKMGEVLDEKAFAGLLDMGEELLKIFPELCISHQRMVGKAFWEAVTRPLPATMPKPIWTTSTSPARWTQRICNFFINPCSRCFAMRRKQPPSHRGNSCQNKNYSSVP